MLNHAEYLSYLRFTSVLLFIVTPIIGNERHFKLVLVEQLLHGFLLFGLRHMVQDPADYFNIVISEVNPVPLEELGQLNLRPVLVDHQTVVVLQEGSSGEIQLRPDVISREGFDRRTGLGAAVESKVNSGVQQGQADGQPRVTLGELRAASRRVT